MIAVQGLPRDILKPKAAGAKQEKRELALREQIRKFVARCDKFERLPEPFSGDCWFCALHDKDGKKWAGYRDPSFIWHMSNRDLREGKKPDTVKRALKRYLYRQCGLA